MKQPYQLVIYLLFMVMLITAVMYFGDKGHEYCPVCNHSMATEGMDQAGNTVHYNY